MDDYGGFLNFWVVDKVICRFVRSFEFIGRVIFSWFVKCDYWRRILVECILGNCWYLIKECLWDCVLCFWVSMFLVKFFWVCVMMINLEVFKCCYY